MTSKIDTDSLRELHAATTIGKWRRGFSGYEAFTVLVGHDVVDFGFGGEKNAEFVAAAHEIWPAVLDELERLRASNKVLSDAYRAADIECGQLRARVSELSSGLAESIERRERRGCIQ